MESTDYQSLSELFKIFSDETRLRILVFLKDGEKTVSDISEKLETSSSAVSHQLNLLRRSKLVRPRRAGRQIFYSLDDRHVSAILSCGIEHLEEA